MLFGFLGWLFGLVEPLVEPWLIHWLLGWLIGGFVVYILVATSPVDSHAAVGRQCRGSLRLMATA